MRRLAAGLLVLALLGACDGGDAGDGDGVDAGATSTAAGSGAATSAPPGSLRLEEVAQLDQPVAFAVAPDGTVHVAEKGGRVRPFREGRFGAPVVDLSREVSTGSEQGLLGIAFAADGRFFAHYTNRSGDTRLDEVSLTDGSRRNVLVVEQPYANHNGGQLSFGPDGFLYLALGDGGSGGDPQGNGQDLGTRLGKILRLDPRPSGSEAFTVPAGNPFADRDGADPLVWHYGLRNPWRFSFDRETGEMWIADVGQGEWEEIDRAGPGVGGQNFGWRAFEGSHEFDDDTDAPGAVGPVHEYDHDDGGCSVTGGYVYRGAALPSLTGEYLFGDFCVGDILALGSDGEARALGLRVEALSSFGEDADGELWLLSLAGPVYRLVAG